MDVEEGLEAARAEVASRAIRYPLGSGQAEELALAAGLRPAIRQLLDAASMERARARFERAGFTTVIAPRVYGPTHDGWDDTPTTLAPEAPGARRALFVGRDRARLDEAAACDLAKTDDADRELGRLLGYPRCCVDAFVSTPVPRKNGALHQAAARASSAFQPRLNVLDLGIFHFVSWIPCAFDCALSLAYADRVAERVARVDAAFAKAIDAALGAHRWVLSDEVQLSMTGRVERDTLTPTRIWPTARDRHPSATLDPASVEAVTRVLALARAATVRGARVEIVRGALEIEGEVVPETRGALLVPFGDRAP